MTNLEVAKNIITGIFCKNHELSEIDDSIFLQIIRSGIEEATKDENGIYEELLEHAIKKYIDIWLDMASKDENEFDVDQEKEEARATFMKYFNNGET